MATSDPKVSLKLLVDTEANRVVFAEAGKEFVDFLFNILSLPLGTVIRILSPQSMVGSIGKVYESVENLSDTYKKASPAALEALLKPKLHTSASVPLLLPDVQKDQNTSSTRFYRCNSDYPRCYDHVTTDPRAKCPRNGGYMDRSMTFIDPPNSNNLSDSPAVVGYVKDVVTYMITDDLEVRPMSVISNITKLDKFYIKDIGLLEGKVVDVGINEGVELLKVSLQSKAVLTEVFLEKKTKSVSVSELTNCTAFAKFVLSLAGDPFKAKVKLY